MPRWTPQRGSARESARRCCGFRLESSIRTIWLKIFRSLLLRSLDEFIPYICYACANLTKRNHHMVDEVGCFLDSSHLVVVSARSDEFRCLFADFFEAKIPVLQ